MNNQSPLSEQKAKLRTHFRQLREMIVSDQRVMAELAIAEFVISTDAFRESERICSFMSFGSEVSTELLNVKIIESNKSLLLPRVSGLRLMDMIHVEADISFEVNTYGIKEPIGVPCDLGAEVPTLCIVPLLAFDDCGHRLGYGGGFYDVFLREHPHVHTIGIAFSCQYSVNALPHEEHDILMDIIITESGIHPIQKKKPA